MARASIASCSATITTRARFAASSRSPASSARCISAHASLPRSARSMRIAISPSRSTPCGSGGPTTRYGFTGSSCKRASSRPRSSRESGCLRRMPIFPGRRSRDPLVHALMMQHAGEALRVLDRLVMRPARRRVVLVLLHSHAADEVTPRCRTKMDPSPMRAAQHGFPLTRAPRRARARTRPYRLDANHPQHRSSGDVATGGRVARRYAFTVRADRALRAGRGTAGPMLQSVSQSGAERDRKGAFPRETSRSALGQVLVTVAITCAARAGARGSGDVKRGAFCPRSDAGASHPGRPERAAGVP